MTTEEYKGRTLEIWDVKDGDPSIDGTQHAVRWDETFGPESHRGKHGLCGNGDPPALIRACRKAIDLYDKEFE